MLYYTQLIYVTPGKEDTFLAFEEKVLPFLEKHNGSLLLRIRPDSEVVIESLVEVPYEIHLVTFQTRKDFENYANDEERHKYLHLKKDSINKVLLIEGNEI